MTLGWAVVGTGSHAQGRMIPALSHASGVRLAAVCSRDLSRAQGIAQQFGFSSFYDSFERLLLNDDVDVVYLCTPNALHAEQTIQAARAGKHVLVEKPMALATDDAVAMVEACDARGVKLGVGFHFRHHAAQPEARRLIEEGKIGNLFLLDARMVFGVPKRDGWWQDPSMIGGYIMGARGCHLIDLLCYLSDAEPEAASMFTDGQRPDRPLEETAVGMLRFPRDTIATFVATRHGDGAPNSFTAYGPTGYLQGINSFGPLGSGILKLSVQGEETGIPFEIRDPFQEEVEAFNRVVSSEPTAMASGLDGLRVVRITEALMESARTGRAVNVPSA